MNNRDFIETIAYVIAFMLLIIWLSANAVAHETKIEKVQEKVVSKATEDNHDKILILMKNLEILQAELDATRTKQELLGQSYTEFTENSEIQQKQEHQEIIKIIPKPVAKKTVVDLPPRIPVVKLAFVLNKYWAINESNFTVRCTFFATAKQDLDKKFILNAKQTLGYKIKFNQLPELECREL